MIQIFSDGGSRGNPGEAASAFVVYKDNEVLHKEAKYLGKATNNVAEYTGVILALEWTVKNLSDLDITFKLDSELVVRQLTGVYKIKNSELMELAMKVKKIIKENNLKISFVHIPRSQNALADKLVNEKLDDSSRH